MAESLTNQGARLLENYGSFQIIESDEAPLVNPGDARVQFVDQFNFIQLNAKRLNTRAPEIRSLRKPVSAFTGRRLHLVQFAGPIKPEWHQALEQTGAKMINYLPYNAYLVYGDAAGLTRLQCWAGAETSVQWEGPYLDDYKIHPQARSVDEKGGLRAIGTDTFAIQLVADDAANAVTLARIDQWKLGPVRKDVRILNYHNVIVPLPAERLQDIAAQPDVISIQPYFEPRMRDERQDQIVAGNLAGNLPGGPGYLGWLASKGFTQAQFDASGFVADLSDSGIDNGTILPGHFGLYRLGTPSHGSRVAYSRLVGTANPGSTLQGCDGHGTINAHILAGYDALDGFPYADSSGYSYGLGVCPFVKVGASVVFDPDNWTSPDYPTLETEAYNGGARISNNSWGSSTAGAYDVDAQSYDALVRDVAARGNNRQMVVVFVTGNDTNAGTINSPGTAKNVITVGAAENVRSLTPANGGNDIYGADGCVTTDSDANNANDMTDFSSRGPCADGRMKPDLVAPGTHITGGVAQNSPATTNGTGSAIPCFSLDGSGVCGLPGSSSADYFFPLGQQFYTVSSGASHAAPAVSGACALLRQFFINNSLTPPSPAMTKAYLMNSARYMTGAYANDTLWSPSQGMGELDLGTAFNGVPRVLRDQLPADKFTASGQTRTFTGFVADPRKPLRVTVAWTDAHGSTAAGPALVNDLDLTMTIGGTIYKGNVFNGAYSVSGGTADSLNNVESVFLPAGQSNGFTVTITAANLAADAVTNGGWFPEQDFALVIYNATSSFVPTAGSYSGLFYEPDGVKLLSSGAFTASTTARGTYSATLQIGANRYRFSGMFDSAGAISNRITGKNANPLTLLLQMDASDNSRIVGTVNGGNWLAELQANRAAFNARAVPAPYVGKYTLIFPGSSDPSNSSVPLGDGYGALTADASGAIKLSGALADGTKLTQTAKVSQNGDWPLYLPLYAGKGQVLGWLSFTTPSAQSDLNGWFNWIKPATFSAKFYPAGFNITTTNVMGSAYNPLAMPVTGFSDGMVSLTGGNLATNITNSVTISLNNRVTGSISNKLTLTLNASQGLFKGSVMAPGTKKTVAFNGAILQDRNTASGYFLGTNQSGRVSFGP